MSFLLYFVGFMVYLSFNDLLTLIIMKDFFIKWEDFLNPDVLSKLDLKNKIINKNIQFESYSYKKSSSRNIVNLFSKF